MDMREREEYDLRKWARRELTHSELREIVKAAHRESIDEYVRKFGWWSIRTIAAMLCGGVVVLALWAAGYTKGG